MIFITPVGIHSPNGVGISWDGGSRHVTVASLESKTTAWQGDPAMLSEPFRWRLVPAASLAEMEAISA